MRKRLLAFLSICLAIVPGAWAQQDSIRLCLLTCEPGKAIYELYGHTAIRLEDYGEGHDIVFNYGMFDFNTPNFALRFALGRTDYVLGAEYMHGFSREYEQRGSVVYEQELNLTADEKSRLKELLFDNAKPENRVYRYNFLYNNCATMAMDKIIESIVGTVTFDGPDTTRTFRNLLTEHTCRRPWSEFAVDIVLGSEVDRPLKYRQESFAPLYLMDQASQAVITDTAGVQRPLVLPAVKVVLPDHEVDFGKPALTPVQTVWLLFMLTLLVSLLGWLARRPFWAYDVLLFSIQGIMGIVIGFLYFLSEHPAVDSNWLVIIFNPLPLIAIPFMVRNIRRGRPDIFLAVEFAVCTAFVLFYPAMPQFIEPAVLILTGTFALRALSSFLQLLFRSLFHAQHVSHSATKRIILAPVLLALSLHASAQIRPTKTDVRPRLIVGITVDQLDGDCLERLLPILGDDGLKKLWTDGYNRTSASFDFESPDRASAVASLYTGASPFQHGIVAGRWMSRKTLDAASVVDDSNCPGVNTIERTSPRRLLATSLADELKLAGGEKSKVCSIGIERDAAVLAAGHEADAALWLNADNAGWCTSQYYGGMPSWVPDSEDRQNAEWKPLYPTGIYVQDSGNGFYRPFSYTIRKDDVQDFLSSPLANDKVTSLALQAIDAMNLGADEEPDLLAVTLYAGNFRHVPNSLYSLEQQDICVRLDRNIADILKKVSETVGLENALVFLTSTGYAENGVPSLEGTRIPSGTVSMEQASALLNLYLSAKYGGTGYVNAFYQNHLYLDRDLIEDKGLSLHQVLESCVDLLVQMSGVKSVLVMRDLMSMVPDEESARKRNAFNTAYSGDIIIESIPGWGIKDERSGTVLYRKPLSRPFPVILYGNGIRAEINREPVSAGVLAPTVAGIARINCPNACQSQPLANLK